MRERSQALKTFLLHKLYRHPQVTHNMARAQQVVRDLFSAYCSAPQEMQAGFAARTAAPIALSRPASAMPQRVVADYIAGMTDRFAAREHARLTGQRLLD